ncbi:uncharacterized protein BJ212DRAFT_178355 [Suillus subaureus]|uniref:Uncharacterized protein n=1 Tax=Suillus subaureus TaxID=48587 RepID=A0A9P7EBI5_9AGAM|nr:uncharacterized protein BJ212DRAFT_178355 [Suillus subaureus]KAG1816847.1 hypothetical protein BJ212DRAFT_178355 [Suillus subaureus]
MDILASISDFLNAASLDGDPPSCAMANDDPILVDAEYYMGNRAQNGFCIIIYYDFSCLSLKRETFFFVCARRDGPGPSLDHTLVVNIPHSTFVVYIIYLCLSLVSLEARDPFSLAHDAMGQALLLTILPVVANIPHLAIATICSLLGPFSRLSLQPGSLISSLHDAMASCHLRFHKQIGLMVFPNHSLDPTLVIDIFIRPSSLSIIYCCLGFIMYFGPNPEPRFIILWLIDRTPSYWGTGYESSVIIHPASASWGAH